MGSIATVDGDPQMPRSSTDVRRARDERDRFVSVVVSGSVYALPIEDVQEIIATRPLSRLFRAPRAFAGVTSLRGEILPVVDLAVLFDEGASSRSDRAGDDARIVVVRERGGAQRRAGLSVAGLGPVREAPRGAARLEAPPATVSPKIRAFLSGLLRDPPLAAVIDVRLLFDAPALAALAGGLG